MYLGDPEELAVPAPLVAHVV